jgi:CubicO group peptidase (beta-lactamase class C family)
VPAVREILPDGALYDWNAMCAALAAEEPWWEPGTAHGYHALTIGWLVGEVVRRIDGRSLGTYFRDEIARPLKLDFHIGLAASEDARTAEMSQPPVEPAPGEPSLMEVVMRDPASVTARAFLNPPILMVEGAVNGRAWRGAEIPAANGHGTARTLARVYGALARGGDLDGVHVLSRELIDRARHEESRGPDLVLQVTTRVGLGYFLPLPGATMGPNSRAFGHPGAGGSLAFADPEARVGFAYVMNRMGPHILIDPRPTALADAFFAAL